MAGAAGEARKRQQAGLERLKASGTLIRGSDRDPRTVRVAQDNAQRAGLTRFIRFEQCRPRRLPPAR
jgi:23S rRNA G2445 N2-methylase RlmL